MTRPKYPSDMVDKFLLRLPDGLRGRIKELAEANRRSMNSEIIVLLERAVFDSFEVTSQNSRPSATGQLVPVSS